MKSMHAKANDVGKVLDDAEHYEMSTASSRTASRRALQRAPKDQPASRCEIRISIGCGGDCILTRNLCGER